jgi:hypothetical protein
VLLLVVIGSPWIAATLWFWRQRPRDGRIPLSMADSARLRLWSR